MTQLIAAAPLPHPGAVSLTPPAFHPRPCSGPVGLPDDGHVTDDLPVVKAFLDRAAAADLQVFFALNGMCPRPLSLQT